MFKKIRGMARVIRGYSRVKKLQDKGLSLKEISNIFDVSYDELVGFVSICHKLAQGEELFSIDIIDDSFLDIASTLET